MKTAQEIVTELKNQFNDSNTGWNQMSAIEHAIQYIESAAKPPELSAEDITESLRNSYFKETGEQALTNDYALWCENKIVEHRQYIQHPQPPYGREVWVEKFTKKMEFPDSEGFYLTIDTTGYGTLTEFKNGHWYSTSGHPIKSWLFKTILPAQVEGEWHSKFSGNVETDQHKIWEHILKLWSEHKDTSFDFIHEMKDKFTLIQNYAHDDKLENNLPAPPPNQ